MPRSNSHAPPVEMLLCFLIGIVPLVLAGQMTLCEYFRKLGVERPECPTVPRLYSRSFHSYGAQYEDESPNAVAPVQTFSSMPLCSMYFHSCMPSPYCESGTVCVSAESGGSCCTNPSQNTCPSPSALNIQCRRMRGVNWCSNDYDCRGSSTMPAKCCPTGCNYNMCINLGVPQTLRLRRFPIAYSQSGDGESCPDPYTLKMTCTVSRPTNWCLSDAECPSVNSIHPRKCCTTICGYNACLVKYNGKWMVG
ncbi:hypothetical protein V3C99_015807 [Haemonchus contortus]